MKNGFVKRYQADDCCMSMCLCCKNFDLIRLAFWIVIVASVSSCSVSKRVSYEDHEGQISKDFFEAIEEHKTKKSWLVSQLGSPMYVMDGPGKFEIYTYQLSRANYFHAGVPLVLKVASVNRKTEYLHIVLENNIVRRAWRDGYSHVQEHALLDALPRKTRRSYLQKLELEEQRYQKDNKMKKKEQLENPDAMPAAKLETISEAPDNSSHRDTQIPMTLPLAKP